MAFFPCENNVKYDEFGPVTVTPISYISVNNVDPTSIKEQDNRRPGEYSIDNSATKYKYIIIAMDASYYNRPIDISSITGATIVYDSNSQTGYYAMRTIIIEPTNDTISIECVMCGAILIGVK